MRVNPIRAVANSCAEWMISCSLNSNMPANARASRIAPLPFCRGHDNPICLAAHMPSARSPIAASSTFSCHESNFNPYEAASSVTSSQALARTYLGACLMRGTSAPSGSATVGDFISSAALSVTWHRVDLFKHVGQA
jgi:hypothetical protein